MHHAVYLQSHFMTVSVCDSKWSFFTDLVTYVNVYTSCMNLLSNPFEIQPRHLVLHHYICMSIPYMARSYSYESWALDTLPGTELKLGSPGQKGQEIMAVRTRVYSTYSNESTYVGHDSQSNGVNLVLQGGQRRGMAVYS